ncbi:MAG TPA: hypothetical protein VH207_08485 [Chthoniobacterales bacterium]|nr:hypothetical protein [Chthoniobacterales bacterium]
MHIPLALASLIFIATAEARIGETSLQFVDRYGAPKDTQSNKISDKSHPLVEGAIHHTYEYQGWTIRAAFLQLDGPAVRMDYQKSIVAGVNPRIQDYELEAIAAANTSAGTSWARVEVTNPNVSQLNIPGRFFQQTVSDAIGEKMWRRSDGATLWLRPGGMFVRLELPAAGEYEAQLKAAKEQKSRASVPSF